MCSQNIYSASTGNVAVKAGLLNLYRLSTGIAEVKTGITILYRLSTILLMVKMCLRKYLHAFNRFCSSENWFAEQLQAFN